MNNNKTDVVSVMDASMPNNNKTDVVSVMDASMPAG